MPRHHNRAILANITDSNLDPKKNYTKVDKSGKFISNSLDKKSVLVEKDLSTVVVSSLEESPIDIQLDIENSVVDLLSDTKNEKKIEENIEFDAKILEQEVQVIDAQEKVQTKSFIGNKKKKKKN